MTHGITYLPHVDVIAVLSNGTVSEVGKYDELMARNGPFADFIHNYGQEDAADEDSFTEGPRVSIVVSLRDRDLFLNRSDQTVNNKTHSCPP